MKIAESDRDLGCIESDPMLWEAPFFFEVLEQIATWSEFHDEVYSIATLVNKLHRYDERVAYLQENELLKLDIL